MKRSFRHVVAVLLFVSMLLLTGCGLTVEDVMNVIAPEETPVPGADLTFQGEIIEDIDPLSLTYQEMDGTFCPFWASRDGDRLVVDLTQFSVRDSAAYAGGTEIFRETNEDGSTTVTVRVPAGLVCSDGYALDASDLLFTYYVLFDADYDGPLALNTLPVRGLSSYWNGMDNDMFFKYIFLYDETYREGKYDKELKSDLEKAMQEARSNGVSEESLANDSGVKEAQKALDAYDNDRAEEIRAAIEAAWHADAANLVEYVVGHYSATIALGTSYTAEEILASEGLQVMATMRERNYGGIDDDGSFVSNSGTVWDLVTEFPTTEDLFDEMYAAYDGDAEQYWMLEGIGRPDMLAAVENELVRRWAVEDEEWRGPVDSIEGLKKLDDRTVSITLDYCDDDMFRILTDIYIAPLHVYGNTELFSPENNRFGFTRGDLRSVRLNSRIAIGGGQYVYRETDIRTVYLDPNEHYFFGVSDMPYVVITKQ